MASQKWLALATEGRHIVEEILAGVSEAHRLNLTLLHRNTSGVVGVEDAARILGVNRTRAAKLLAWFARQGWARRLRRGLYVLIPLDATSPRDWSPDAWVVADRVFRPCYIAGWSACEYWGLTEQIFRDVAVFTSALIRERRTEIDGVVYLLRKIGERITFGTRKAWRRETPVRVSDPTRTVVDVLDQPRWGGGIRHVVHIVDAYFHSEHRDDELIVTYIERLDSRAAAKRLGLLAEHMNLDAESLVARLQPLVASGYVLLDPTVPARGPHVARWGVRMNVDVTS